jgi:hypothetical protein
MRSSAMFSLENAVSAWREQMLATGIKTPVPLDELESHLRDHIEEKVRAGLSEQQAFDAAVFQVGQAKVLKAEFKKIRTTTERNQIISVFTILAALFGTVLGGAMVLPALGRWHQAGVLILWPLVLGSILVTVGGGGALFAIKRYRLPRGRNLISLAIIAAGAFYVAPLAQAFFIPKADLIGWIVCAFLAVASTLFFGMCFRLNRNLPTPPVCEN